jgi:hypothetical protein
MTREAYKALDMLNAFASVGVQRFDVTFTDLEGNKLEKAGYMSNRHINSMRSAVGHILQKTDQEQHNFIIRPRRPERAEIIQLDDLNAEQAQRFKHRAFMTLCTSPGNYQAWVAVSDSEPDFARRLRKGAGADPSASGATRVSGSRNFKRQYAPAFPLVEITERNLGQMQTRAELEDAGLVAAKEQSAPAPIRVPPTRAGRKAWPSYTRCVQDAPPIHGGEKRPDISKADFIWCLLAIKWGWSIEDTAKMLMQESTKAQENGENYARNTARNAADAAARSTGNSR